MEEIVDRERVAILLTADMWSSPVENFFKVLPGQFIDNIYIFF